nr:uncharacterized protein LOC109176733 [Ipomoea trifida]
MTTMTEVDVHFIPYYDLIASTLTNSHDLTSCYAILLHLATNNWLPTGKEDKVLLPFSSLICDILCKQGFQKHQQEEELFITSKYTIDKRLFHRSHFDDCSALRSVAVTKASLFLLDLLIKEPVLRKFGHLRNWAVETGATEQRILQACKPGSDRTSMEDSHRIG